jgi:DNA polymerase III subunit delta
LLFFQFPCGNSILKQTRDSGSFEFFMTLLLCLRVFLLAKGGINLSSFYVLYGSERFFVEEERRKVINSVLGDDANGLFVYDMKESSMEEVMEEARTTSLFGDKKVVLLKDCFFLTGEKSRVKHEVDDLLSYIESPTEETTLIFDVNNEKLDKRKKLVKSLIKNKSTKVFESKPLKNVQYWIEKRFEVVGIKVTAEIITLISQQLGNSLFLLDSEINKLAAACGTNQTLDTYTVESLLSRTLENDVFKLIDRIAKKQKSAINLLDDLFKMGEDPIKILLLMARQYRIMLQVKLFEKKGYKISSIAGLVKIAPFVAKIASEQAREYEVDELFGKLQECSVLDSQMKTGKVNKTIALETIIAKWI